MGTYQNSTLSVDALLRGDKVACRECGKGCYQPLNPSYKVNHYFVCDHCGSSFHWDPVVNIE